MITVMLISPFVISCKNATNTSNNLTFYQVEDCFGQTSLHLYLDLYTLVLCQPPQALSRACWCLLVCVLELIPPGKLGTWFLRGLCPAYT